MKRAVKSVRVSKWLVVGVLILLVLLVLWLTEVDLWSSVDFVGN